MNKISIASAALLAPLLATLLAPRPAQAQAADCSVVEVQNVRPSQGRLLLAVYADAGEFTRRAAVAQQQQQVGASSVIRFAVCNLRGQTVALSLVQDLNANGRPDFNLLGLPVEPWGTSGTVPTLSAPTWDSSKLVLDGQPLVIRMSN